MHDEERQRPESAAPGTTGRGRAIVAVVAGVMLVALIAAGVVARRAAGRAAAEAPSTIPAVQTIDESGWRFTIHLPTGAEGLYRLSDDPDCRENLVHEERERAADMRTLLLARSGAGTVDALRAPYRRVTESLRRLGYL